MREIMSLPENRTLCFVKRSQYLSVSSSLFLRQAVFNLSKTRNRFREFKGVKEDVTEETVAAKLEPFGIKRSPKALPLKGREESPCCLGDG